MCIGPLERLRASREIEIHEVLDKLLPSLRERETLLGVFYTPADEGITPDLDEFERDLRTELSRIE